MLFYDLRELQSGPALRGKHSVLLEAEIDKPDAAIEA